MSARRTLAAKESQRHEARSLAIRLKDAQKRRDADTIAAIRHELEQLEHEIRAKAAT